ncbi:hypothetical protein [Zhongshania marina]|uniref:Lipoprotein n=1 Tax=Zhongshania marina TaxID=2304603 RepID=A0ABX9W6H8_9GAMM|nr:hypothetical protein D0911_03270 [Zhongshania marina]
MLKKSLFIIFTIILTACERSEPNFDTLGVYIPTNSGFTRLDIISGDDDYSKIITIDDIENNNITFYAYDPDIKLDSVAVIQSTLDLRKTQPLNHQIKPLSKDGTFAIEAQIVDPNLPLIILKTISTYSIKVYTVSISNIEALLVEELKASNNHSTRAKYTLLARALKNFPENSELLRMKSELKVQLAEEAKLANIRQLEYRDNTAYTDAKNKEKFYKSRDKWIEEYQQYLAEFPNGIHANKVKERIKEIQAEITQDEQIYLDQLRKFEKLTIEFVQAIKAQDKDRLSKMAYQSKSADSWLRSNRLSKADYSSIKAVKFHYSNAKTRNYAYVQLSGTPLKQLKFKLRDDQWYVSGYVI